LQLCRKSQRRARRNRFDRIIATELSTKKEKAADVEAVLLTMIRPKNT
jgi:hypothetical protein